MNETTRVRLRGLRVENYQAIKLVEFAVRRGINDIAGSPAQGKSTIPQAIKELFTKGGVSSMPLRRGAAEGSIIATFDDGSVVEKRLGPKGASPTRRTDAEGKKTGIDSLTGWISPDVCNPLAFAALSESKPGRRAQAEIISEIAGLDTGPIDTERAQHLAAESAAAKAAEDLEAQARGVVVPALPIEVPSPIDEASIASRKGEVEKQKAANDTQRRDAATADKSFREASKRVDDLEVEITKVEARLADLRGQRTRALDEATAKGVTAHDLSTAAAALVDPTTDAIDAEIAAAKLHNERSREAAEVAREHNRTLGERAKLQEKAAAKRTEERAAGMKKRECDAKKAEAIATAAKKMPVAGLTIEGEGADREVYMNAVPLSQASTMQRLQLGCALALARNPKLGFLWIDYGNELDETALCWLQGFLEEHNADAFVVHVVLDGTKIDEADGLIVEGGEVVADRRKTRKARTAAPKTVAALDTASGSAAVNGATVGVGPALVDFDEADEPPTM